MFTYFYIDFQCSLFMGHFSTGKTVFAFVFFWVASSFNLNQFKAWNAFCAWTYSQYTAKNVPWNTLKRFKMETRNDDFQMANISSSRKRQQTRQQTGEIRGWSRALLPWNNPVIDLVKLEIERSILGAHLKMSRLKNQNPSNHYLTSAWSANIMKGLQIIIQNRHIFFVAL